jgi:hypothetical protein
MEQSTSWEDSSHCANQEDSSHCANQELAFLFYNQLDHFPLPVQQGQPFQLNLQDLSL